MNELIDEKDKTDDDETMDDVFKQLPDSKGTKKLSLKEHKQKGLEKDTKESAPKKTNDEQVDWKADSKDNETETKSSTSEKIDDKETPKLPRKSIYKRK